MHRRTIKGFEVELPYEPYPAQVQTMETILTCLEEKVSGMVESPTGTGKSLSILCAVSAWLKKTKMQAKENEAVPRIYICSRTHRQITQLVDQLKTLKDQPSMVVLASRTHLCMHREVQREADKKEACKKKRDVGECVFFGNRDKLEEHCKEEPFNIEDLITYGRKHKLCPYYGIKEISKKAEVVFAPYNYIINPQIRRAMNIELEDAAVIVDEGHNIDDVCRTVGSVEITKEICTALIRKIAAIWSIAGEENPDGEKAVHEHLTSIKLVAEQIEAYIVKKQEELHKRRGRAQEDAEITIRQNAIVEELEKMGLSQASIARFCSSAEYVSQNSTLQSSALEEFSTQVAMVAKQILAPGEKRYCIVVSETKMTFVCLHAEAIFGPIEAKARCVVLLSGTLSPFAEITKELLGPRKVFAKTERTSHVIGESQVHPVCIPAYEGRPLMGTYAGMQESSYLPSVCAIITEIATGLARVGGVLCFVPSYAVLEKISTKIQGITVCKEPSDPNKFEQVLQTYRKKSAYGRCVFLCVFRGRASEGIDFKNHEARAVLVVGVPFPNLKSYSISLKKEYNDTYLLGTGRLWYEYQAYKAVNQAIGRCIRHKDDWGSVFLLDVRYSYSSNIKNLSSWAVKNLSVEKEFASTKTKFTRFIEKWKDTSPPQLEEKEKYINSTSNSDSDSKISVINRFGVDNDIKKRKITRYFH
ncbi:regulator of telomere elongation helicase 1 [Nematocida sp. AWRm77]|nr:regulator of telomere elongation helicase 1 [Nematocida sp. AWRm77]